MIQDARRYIRVVLAIHLALLLGVVAVLALASREIYRTTRQQAIEQAVVNQSLLAAQTAAAIQAHFDAILDTLDLLRRSDVQSEGGGSVGGASGGLDTPLAAAAAEMPGGFRPRVVMRLLAPILWEQLQGRVSHLLIVDREALGERGTPGVTPEAATASAIVQAFAASDARDPLPYLVAGTRWLTSIDSPAVSGAFGEPGDRAFLVVVPMLRPAVASPDGGAPGSRPPQRPTSPPGPGAPVLSDGYTDTVGEPVGEALEGRYALVAVVPRQSVVDRFLMKVNSPEAQARRIDTDVVQPAPAPAGGRGPRLEGVTLLDEVGTIIGAPDEALAGKSMLTGVADGAFQDLIRSYINDRVPRRDVIDRPLQLGEFRLDSAVIAAQPVTLRDRTWWVLITSSLADVNRVVDSTFARAGRWAAFVIVAITAILVSTAWQMIKGRTKLERMRTEMIDRELDQARQIQLDWLPPAHGEGRGMKIVAVNEPASHISGDFYDWFDLSGGRTVLTIGDVTGHGMAAAFLMATCQLLVRNTMQKTDDPGRCLEEVNRQLCTQSFNGQFVTMLVAVIDPATGEIATSCAGHPPPLVGVPDRGFRAMDLDPQLVLGVEADMDFPTQRHHLPPDACLLLYTDGVTEAESTTGERYNVDLLAADLTAMQQGRGVRTADDLATAVRTAVDTFRQDQPIADDLTYVAVHLEPSDRRPRDLSTVVPPDASPGLPRPRRADAAEPLVAAG